jgi:hypothetical protein
LPWGVWDSSPWWSGRVYPVKTLFGDRRRRPTPVFRPSGITSGWRSFTPVSSSQGQRQPRLESSFVRLFRPHYIPCHFCDGFPVFLRPEHQVDEIFLFRPLCRLLHHLESEPIPPGALKKFVFCIITVRTIATAVGVLLSDLLQKR